MIRLAESFDGFRAKLSSVGTLVGLATKMVDTEDMLLVKRVLSADVWSFLGQLKFHQQILSSTVTGKCSQDGATLVKGQEISRIYSDAGSLVQSVVKKVARRAIGERSAPSPTSRPAGDVETMKLCVHQLQRGSRT
jgi:hypothetical protein